MNLINKVFYPIAIIIIAILFFYQTLLKGFLPIPADTIIGLYHPFRDLYSKDYPNGIPYKNFLITDPIRQQYPWKKLATEIEKKFEIPLWNPYSLSGTPLLANFQSSPLYPLNIFLIVLPFNLGWSILIFSQILLAGIFMFFYLKNQDLKRESAFLGAITFAFSGFSIAWLEWGTVVSTVLWVPLVLLSIDNLFKNKSAKWTLILIFSLICSFFAGHLQIFFYTLILYIFYTLFILTKSKSKRNILFIFTAGAISLILVLPQLIPTLKFIALSARSVDLDWHIAGWFIPIKQLIQFLVPDYFGNPTTLNYSGVWNYGEMIGYVGILPLILTVFALFTKKSKAIFFLTVIIFALPLSLQTIIASIPFLLNIPFLSTAQPTRLLSLIDISLSILAAYGFDYLLSKPEKRKVLITILGFLFALILIFSFTMFGSRFGLSLSNISVAKRNLYFPGLILVLVSLMISLFVFVKNIKFKKVIIVVLILITIFDLFRFGWKFTPFTKSGYLFPSEKILTYLQGQKDKNFRIMSDNSEIFPPNFSVIYHLQSVDGYDPLYLLRYGELVSSMERNRPDISTPFGLNRLITPRNFNSKIFPLFNIKYLLSFSDIVNPNFSLVMKDGKTKLYEYKKVLPRAFFVSSVLNSESKNDSINKLYDNNFDPLSTAVVEDFNSLTNNYSVGDAKIVSYSENRIKIQVDNNSEGFLILLDSYYPTWQVKIDGNLSRIYVADYNFRGVLIPAGKHIIEFSDNLL